MQIILYLFYGGILVFFFGCAFLSAWEQRKAWITIDAVITKYEDITDFQSMRDGLLCRVELTYTIDSKTYNSSLLNGFYKRNVDDTVTVYYLKSNPEKISINPKNEPMRTYILYGILLICGVGLIAFGILRHIFKII
jgi:hypothetical protein